MAELAINVSPENLVLGAFVMGLTLVIIGHGARVVLRGSGGSDPEL